MEAILVLYARMLLLLGIGIPSLLIATSKQSGLPATRTLYVLPYGIGGILAVAYILFYDYGSLRWFFNESAEEVFNGINAAHQIQIIGAIVQLIIPCSLLIIKEMIGKRQLKLLLFLSGGLIFGLSLVIGVGTKPQNIGLYYIASIPVGMMWIWAVFLDIKDMKGKVGLLKEELQLVIKSNTSEKTKDIRVLLENLEGVSHGNLDVYKMRIREILNMLTDTTIEAGGDTDSLLQRNVDKTKAIQHSKDATQVKEIIYNEAVELSEMISDIPQQKNALAVNKVVDYLKGNFSEDISVDEIARMAGLSKAHLMREFKKNIGQTILQYQTKLRIEASQNLLIHQTVTETAYQVGYNNPNYFSTVFRKVTGFSPIEFQEKNRNTTL
ncbi:AraC family transcriptional regulator [Flammeovirga yaeyamensis]|uniref:AraC family transcriptional regulator n=1 Tax=Flammeovirga yaeyamensis TaxID=367791 RepID=A0AAX1ND64_9BACT|nr:helix-turn-helix domain-containing protein [Flammeovirga yaeyamensis]NMF35178.1 helix-turn-helix transcriptional regulator [Flammeovirga yaeyamensis]QWG04042.1 AraC family transcriptional regulator [Flammeovirga yaeyamensis]